LVRRDKKTKEIYGHTGVPDLVKLFSKFTKKIVLVHFGNWFYQNIKKSRKKIDNLARQYGIKIIVGYDGLKINV
jgi:hypothetical protein